MSFTIHSDLKKKGSDVTAYNEKCIKMINNCAETEWKGNWSFTWQIIKEEEEKK